MIADAPKFMDLFEKVRLELSMNNIYLQSRVLNFKSVSAYMLNDCFQTREVVGSDVDTASLQLNIYTSVVYAFLVIAGIFVIVAFFGCCGAAKHSRCLLATVSLRILSIAKKAIFNWISYIVNTRMSLIR